MSVAVRFEKIDELFAKILDHTCELIKTSEASLLEIAVAATYISKALLKIVAMTGDDMVKVVDIAEKTLSAGLDDMAIQEIVDFIRKNTTKEEENV
jgi:hypothetical protein